MLNLISWPFMLFKLLKFWEYLYIKAFSFMCDDGNVPSQYYIKKQLFLNVNWFHLCLSKYILHIIIILKLIFIWYHIVQTILVDKSQRKL